MLNIVDEPKWTLVALGCDRIMDESLRTRIESILRDAMAARDPLVAVSCLPRGENMFDATIVSVLFEGLGSEERERLFWPAMDLLSPSDRVRMTYCLLLAPDDAERYYAER